LILSTLRILHLVPQLLIIQEQTHTHPHDTYQTRDEASLTMALLESKVKKEHLLTEHQIPIPTTNHLRLKLSHVRPQIPQTTLQRMIPTEQITTITSTPSSSINQPAPHSPQQPDAPQLLQPSTTATTSITSSAQNIPTTPPDPSTPSFNSLRPALRELQRLIRAFNSSVSTNDSYRISFARVYEHSANMEIELFPSSDD
jgi:hypothetical protein